MHTCPVCGYDALWRAPTDFLICPSCGTEFGYHDIAATPEATNQRRIELRNGWVASGPRWHSQYVPEPPNWNPYEQFRGLKLRAARSSEAGMSHLAERLAREAIEKMMGPPQLIAGGPRAWSYTGPGGDWNAIVAGAIRAALREAAAKCRALAAPKSGAACARCGCGGPLSPDLDPYRCAECDAPAIRADSGLARDMRCATATHAGIRYDDRRAGRLGGSVNYDCACTCHCEHTEQIAAAIEALAE